MLITNPFVSVENYSAPLLALALAVVYLLHAHCARRRIPQEPQANAYPAPNSVRHGGTNLLEANDCMGFRFAFFLDQDDMYFVDPFRKTASEKLSRQLILLSVKAGEKELIFFRDGWNSKEIQVLRHVEGHLALYCGITDLEVGKDMLTVTFGGKKTRKHDIPISSLDVEIKPLLWMDSGKTYYGYDKEGHFSSVEISEDDLDATADDSLAQRALAVSKENGFYWGDCFRGVKRDGSYQLLRGDLDLPKGRDQESTASTDVMTNTGEVVHLHGTEKGTLLYFNWDKYDWVPVSGLWNWSTKWMPALMLPPCMLVLQAYFHLYDPTNRD